MKNDLTKRLSKYMLLALMLTSFTFVFYDNAFNTVEPNLFEHFQKDGESLVIGRLLKSKNDGVFSEGGFLGWTHPDESLLEKETKVLFKRFGGWGYKVPYSVNKFSYQYEAFNYNYKVRAYEKYFSESGGQSLIYNLLGKALGVSGNKLIELCHFLNSFLLALILSLFLMWVLSNFGILPTLICFVFILLSQWLVVYADNMLYVTGLFFLPMVCNLWYLHFYYKKSVFKIAKLCWLTFFTVLLKCTIAGYNFVIPTLVMATIPLIFYYYVNKHNFVIFFKHFLYLSLAALSALIIGLFILAIQLAVYYESWGEALHYLVHTTERRTYGNQHDLLDVVNRNESITLLKILEDYLNGAAILSPLLHIKVTFKSLFALLFLISTAIPLMNLKTNRYVLGLTIITWVSLIGPIAWFVIFKNHSIIHIHMNLVLWYLPSLLFGSVLIGYVIKQGVLPFIYNRDKKND